jgi:adenosyl cobinamide kinase/adenosyl cobinamide phosphate guanylyltransferase
MAARIEAHRRERPSEWETIEEPYELVDGLASIDPDRLVVVDCLSLWVSNLLERDDDPETIVLHSSGAAEIATRREAPTIVVSNEVGLGVVPATLLGRAYRDLLGSVNRGWVDVASFAALVVAGRALPLEDAPALVSRMHGEVLR